MKIEHIAIWTPRLEVLKGYYETYFNAKASPKYANPNKQFQSYFLSFESGTRLELMFTPRISEEPDLREAADQIGITHFAFEMPSMEEVDQKAAELAQAGYTVLDGPRTTGDGYYEFVTLDPDKNRLEVTTLAK